ncbi:hypothetical protein HY483_01635 [Candidatus Woesearchaeota archaeon]|nr:hypothetical protein [Candidatus Woesearchaeota archaeon]
MKNEEFILREILYQAFEKRNRVLTQSALSKTLALSLSVVNKIIQKLELIGAVDVKQRNFHVTDPKKILYYWASKRNLHKDVIYSTRVEKPVRVIEKDASNNSIFTAYTAYKRQWGEVPADYSEIYMYDDENAKERYPPREGVPNIYILKKDPLMRLYGKKTTIANTFVDLWNMKEWYAKEFVQALEVHINGILEQ